MTPVIKLWDVPNSDWFGFTICDYRLKGVMYRKRYKKLLYPLFKRG